MTKHLIFILFYLPISVLASITIFSLARPDDGMTIVRLLRTSFIKAEVVQPQVPVKVKSEFTSKGIRIIPIQLTIGGKTIDCKAFVDSGAEATFIPSTLIDSLSDSVSPTRTIETITLNGERTDVVFEDVTIAVGDAQVKANVITNVDIQMNKRPYCLLGQDFLSKFTYTQTKDYVTFSELE